MGVWGRRYRVGVGVRAGSVGFGTGGGVGEMFSSEVTDRTSCEFKILKYF